MSELFKSLCYTVGLISDKGGCGKSTLAHSLAGAMRDFCATDGTEGRGAYVLTDNRMLLDGSNRWYDILEGRDTELLRGYVGAARAKTELGLLVIDGAGGNPDADKWYAESLCDLTLIPTTPDEESVICAILYANKFPKAYVVPNRWSTNANAARVDQHYLDILAEEIGAHRILPPLPAVHSLSEFVRSDFAGDILPPARAFGRNFATIVLRLLEEIKASKKEVA